jgi:hypothetical protein
MRIPGRNLLLAVVLLVSALPVSLFGGDEEQKVVQLFGPTRLKNIVRDQRAPGEPIIALELRSYQMTNAEMKHVAKRKSLQSLSLYTTAVTAPGLRELRGLKKLTTLDLRGTHAFDAELLEVSKLTNLRKLRVNGSWITEPAWRALAKLKSLEVLVVSISGAGEPVPSGLKEFKHLKVLDLDFSSCHKPILTGLRDLKALRSIHLDHTSITDKSLKELGACRTIKSLDLTMTKITVLGLRYLRNLDKLETLRLANTNVTDEEVEELHRFKSLKNLDISYTKVSKAGLRGLETALPKCAIRAQAISGVPIHHILAGDGVFVRYPTDPNLLTQPFPNGVIFWKQVSPAGWLSLGGKGRLQVKGDTVVVVRDWIHKAIGQPFPKEQISVVSFPIVKRKGATPATDPKAPLAPGDWLLIRFPAKPGGAMPKDIQDLMDRDGPLDGLYPVGHDGQIDLGIRRGKLKVEGMWVSSVPPSLATCIDRRVWMRTTRDTIVANVSVEYVVPPDVKE